MTREFLRGLELDNEVIDYIMAEHGATTQRLREELDKQKELNGNLTKKNQQYESDLKDFMELKKVVEQEEAQKQEEILVNNIKSVFGDKKFVNEYTEKAIIDKIREESAKPENQGRSNKELFEEITKDSTDLFVSENKLTDMTGMGDTETQTNTNTDMTGIW